MTVLQKRLAKRGSKRRNGLILLAVGLFVLVDSPSMVPIPLVGWVSVLVSLFILIVASTQLSQGISVAWKEGRDFLHFKKGSCSLKELQDFLGEEGDAMEVVEELERLGIGGLATQNFEFVQEHDYVEEDLVVLRDWDKGKLDQSKES